MREGGGPVASEVVQRRLAELFAQLQEAPAEPDQPSAVSLVADDEEWLARLRPVADDPPEPESAASASRGVHAVLERAVGFTREHLTTVIVVLLVGLVWTAYSLLQVRSVPVADAAPRVQASSSPGAAETTANPTTPNPTPAKPVVVHVIGAVAHPGVVRLPEGARVSDAITAAGGLNRSAAIGELNLAQVLADGTQLKIGTKEHPGGWIRDGDGDSAGAGSSSSGSSTKVSLNKATLQQLDALPGIGPVTAQKILDWRKAHGRFTAITELQEVDGIGPKTYADLAGLVQL